jgi:hypothetical protein
LIKKWLLPAGICLLMMPLTALADASWPMLRHDEGRTSYNSDVGSFRPPLAWLDTITLEDEAEEPFPILNVVTGPRRIFAQGQWIIWGVMKDDPSIQWRNDDCLIEEGNTDYCFINYLAYSSDRLVFVKQKFFFSTFDFGWELVVLHAATGLVDWSMPLGDTAPEISITGESILLLVEESAEGKLIKMDLARNQAYKVNADISGFPDSRAVIAGGRFVYANGSRILAHDVETGDQTWVYTDNNRVDNTRSYDLVATGDAVIVSQGERVIKLNASDGAFVWEKDIRPDVCNSALYPNAAATDGVIIAVTSVCDEEVVALDYDSGVEEWRKNIGPVGSPDTIAIGGDVLYTASVTTPLFNIFAFDPVNGTELEKMELNIGDEEWDTSSVLAISDGLLLFASNLGSRIVTRFERTPADVSAKLDATSIPACGASTGGVVTFEFIVTNHGPGTTDNTRADLVLPDGEQTITLEPNQGSCTTGAEPYCELGPLSVGQTIRIEARVVLSKAGSYSPGISLSGAVRDPNELNDQDSQPLTVDPSAPSGLDLMLTDMEITQGLQNLANTIPLVRGKPIFVRVYGRTNGDAIKNVNAVLHGELSGSGEDLGTLDPIPAAACQDLDGEIPDRTILSESWVFELPEPWWRGGVIYTAEINPEGAIPDNDPANDHLTLTRQPTDLPRICLKTYPVRTKGKRTSGSDETDRLFPDPWSIADDSGNILSRAFTMLPTRELKVYPSSHLIEEWEPLSEEGWGPYEMEKEEDNRGDVLDTLWWHNLFGDDPDLCDVDDSRTHYIGMVHQGTSNGVGSAGLGIRDGDEAMLFLNTGPNGPQAFDDPHAGFTLAHELGHNYDRGHINCGGPKNTDKQYPKDRNRCNFAPADFRGYFGLEFRDPTTPTVIAPMDPFNPSPDAPPECPDVLESDQDGDGIDDSCDNCPAVGNPGQEDTNQDGEGDYCEVGMAGDLMSYADDVWPGDYTWKALQAVLCDANDCTFPGSASAPAGAVEPPPPITGDVLLIRGLVSPVPGLQQAYRLPVSQVPKADEEWAKQVASRPLEIVYALNLVDGGDAILHSEPFNPKDSSDQEAERSSFGLVIPWDPATARIELTENGTPVDSMEVSASAPEVTSISPDGGENFTTDSLDISWTASDADGDDLIFTVLYSCDNGGSWNSLVTGTGETAVTVDSSLLPGGDGLCLVRVIASDGLNSGWRQSASGFTMPDRMPSALIYFPDDGDTYSSGSSLTLQGAIYDPEDDYLADENMIWELTGHGVLGNGNHLPLTDLADGDYTLTLSGSDSAAQEGSLSISFTIGPEPEFDSNPNSGATIDFGDQPEQIESQPKIVRVANLGAADLSLECALSGANPGSFNIMACPAIVTGEISDEITISCQPETLGAKEAVLELTSNDKDEPNPIYFLTCNGVEAPLGEIIFSDGFEN